MERLDERRVSGFLASETEYCSNADVFTASRSAAEAHCQILCVVRSTVGEYAQTAIHDNWASRLGEF
jgi:hypothetical protein